MGTTLDNVSILDWRILEKAYASSLCHTSKLRVAAAVEIAKEDRAGVKATYRASRRMDVLVRDGFLLNQPLLVLTPAGVVFLNELRELLNKIQQRRTS